MMIEASTISPMAITMSPRDMILEVSFMPKGGDKGHQDGDRKHNNGDHRRGDVQQEESDHQAHNDQFFDQGLFTVPTASLISLERSYVTSIFIPPERPVQFLSTFL